MTDRTRKPAADQRRRKLLLGAGVAAMFVIAWLVVDARWQWNLLRQATATHAQYADKSWQERHLAAEDGRLFAFIEKVRGALARAVEPKGNGGREDERRAA